MRLTSRPEKISFSAAQLKHIERCFYEETDSMFQEYEDKITELEATVKLLDELYEVQDKQLRALNIENGQLRLLVEEYKKPSPCAQAYSAQSYSGGGLNRART